MLVRISTEEPTMSLATVLLVTFLLSCAAQAVRTPARNRRRTQ